MSLWPLPPAISVSSVTLTLLPQIYPTHAWPRPIYFLTYLSLSVLVHISFPSTTLSPLSPLSPLSLSLPLSLSNSLSLLIPLFPSVSPWFLSFSLSYLYTLFPFMSIYPYLTPSPFSHPCLPHTQSSVSMIK